MSDELNPCPICGAHAKIKTLFDDFYIEIFEGRATRAIYATKQDAIDAWNRCCVQPTFTPDELDAIRRNVRDWRAERELSKIEQAIIDKCANAVKGGSVE